MPDPRPATPRHHRRRPNSGFALVTVAFSIVSLVGTVGLGVDIGRMYIAKNEAQLTADSTSLAAALELDGTPAGLARARNIAAASLLTPEFAPTPDGPFSPTPKSATGIRYLRVTAAAPVPIYFLRVTGAPATSTARASAVAGQIEKSTFREGLFPFAIEDTGLTPGTQYPLRYFASPDAAALRPAILSDTQTLPVSIKDTLTLLPTPDAAPAAIAERIAMDSDPTSATFATYTGNGRRIVAVPVTDANAQVQTYAALFLLPDTPTSAEFLGPWLQGSRYLAAATANSGAYVVRLVQ